MVQMFCLSRWRRVKWLCFGEDFEPVSVPKSGGFCGSQGPCQLGL